ncbi:hypothetical protein BVY01_02570 [bacterium I07]|nr:hypothetical protein BVY01_02570 [bacterium I07]
MLNKTIALLTFIGLICSSFSCYSSAQSRMGSTGKREYREIERVILQSGEIIDFPDHRPGRLIVDKIVGGVGKKVNEKIFINRSDILLEKRNAGKLIEITTKEGCVYYFSHCTEGTEQITIQEYEVTKPIPYSEVKYVYEKEKKSSGILMGLAILTGIILTVVLIFKLGSGMEGLANMTSGSW